MRVNEAAEPDDHETRPVDVIHQPPSTDSIAPSAEAQMPQIVKPSNDIRETMWKRDDDPASGPSQSYPQRLQRRPTSLQCLAFPFA